MRTDILEPWVTLGWAVLPMILNDEIDVRYFDDFNFLIFFNLGYGHELVKNRLQ